MESIEQEMSEGDEEIDYNDPDLQKIGDDYVFNPFNPLNNEITLNDIQSILQKYNVNYTVLYVYIIC